MTRKPKPSSKPSTITTSVRPHRNWYQVFSSAIEIFNGYGQSEEYKGVDFLSHFVVFFLCILMELAVQYMKREIFDTIHPDYKHYKFVVIFVANMLQIS